MTRKDPLHLSTPATLDNNLKESLYLGQATEALPDQRVDKPYILSETRLTQSITMGQAVNSPLDRPTVPGSVNSSMHATKNKRKSDYM